VDHRIPRVGVVISIVLAIMALITFIFLNQRFQGPDPASFLRNPYELTARFTDNKTLPTKQPVLYRGINVGTVTRVDYDKDKRESVVTFTLEPDFRIRQDAVIRIGARSLLGDPYLAVDSRGTDGSRELESGDEVERTETSVDFDEALAFLDEEGRKRVRSLITTVAQGTAAPGNGERLNGTLAGVSRTVNELHVLTKTVRGQEPEIAELVKSANTVLTTLGDREESIRTIVSSGRSTLEALGSNTASLERGLDELPRLLSSGRTSLARLRPLFDEARPVFTKLSTAAPELADALDPDAKVPLGDVVGDLNVILRGLGPLNDEARPTLRRLEPLLKDLLPVVRAGVPGARNLVPALSYLTPRSKAIATGYALLAGALKNTDATGRYARVGFDISETGDPPEAGQKNPYPGPDDALDPKPFTGEYPRIVPCTVPSRSTPKEPCK